MRTIIITRFAIELSKTPYFNTLNGENWFNDRLSLFNQICLPSVLAQKTLPNLWFIYIVENSKYYERLSKFTRNYEFIKIIQIPHLEPFKSSVSRTLVDLNLLKSCTIRLDCDDALFPNYISDLKLKIREFKTDILFEPRKGLSLLVENNCITRAAIISKKLPPFLAFKNSSQEDFHVFSYDHDSWPLTTNTVTITEKPEWVQITHDKNVSNIFGWGWLVTTVHEFNPITIQNLIPKLNAVSTPIIVLVIRNFKNKIKQIKKQFT